MKKYVIGLLVVLIFAVATIAITRNNRKNTSTTKPLPTFNIGMNTWVGYGPIWLAQDKGFFKEEGLDVNITVIEDSFQRKAAVLNKSIDGLADTVDLLVLARDQKVPSVAVMQIDLSNGADGILSTNNYKTIADLKGAKVAVQKNFVSESMLYYALAQNNMKPSDVQVIDMEAGAAGAAFLAKQVDVAVTFEPWMSKSKDRANTHILVSSKDYPGVISDILSVREDYLQNHPEDLQKFMRGWFKALDYIKSNPEEANQIMAKHYDISAADFADFSSGLVWPNYNDNIHYFGDSVNKGEIYNISNTFSKIFLETGQINTTPDINSAISSSPLKNLYDNKH
jgi:NitT/TauT family transport system substrate-binding protein